tara:strand:+ start:133 stop:567 length:435 start_codon:yes stop_codon:yes gene_type:complete
MELKSTQHGYGQNTYHLVFVPKCRCKYFKIPSVKEVCEQTFKEVAEKYNFNIHSLEIQPDHVHLFVSFPPSYSISKVVQLFKGTSGYKLLRRHPRLRGTPLRRDHFWSAGKFYRSVGNVTAETIQHYIEQSQHGWHFQHQTKLF